MKRKPLTSSLLNSVAYDASHALLEVEFRDGSVYRYENVPPDVHEDLLRAESHGKFFIRYIRNEYPYERIEDENAQTD